MAHSVAGAIIRAAASRHAVRIGLCRLIRFSRRVGMGISSGAVMYLRLAIVSILTVCAFTGGSAEAAVAIFSESTLQARVRPSIGGDITEETDVFALPYDESLTAALSG